MLSCETNVRLVLCPRCPSPGKVIVTYAHSPGGRDLRPGPQVIMTYDSEFLEVEELRVSVPLYYVIVDLRAEKVGPQGLCKGGV